MVSQGNPFVLSLQSELLCPDASERFQLILEALFIGIGPNARQALVDADDLMMALHAVSIAVKQAKPIERANVLQTQLEQIRLTQPTRLPSHPTTLVQKLRIEECKVFESKTVKFSSF